MYKTYSNEILDEIRKIPSYNKYKIDLMDLETNYNRLMHNPEIRNDFAIWEEVEENTSKKLLEIMRGYRKEKIISSIDKIYIIDALMGIGKTSYILNLLNDEMFYKNVSEEIANFAKEGIITAKTAKSIQISSTPKRFICIVPTLDEVDRYKKELPFIESFDPKNFTRKDNKHISKLESFKDLIKLHKNVVTTHALIKLLDSEAMELLRTSDYTLVIDEELNVVEPYTGITHKGLETLFNTNLVSVDKDGFLIWNEDDDDRPFELNNIKRLCQLNSLMLYNRDITTKKLLIWNFPFPFFSLFKKCFICTYQWNGSIQKAYFDLHDIKYDHMTLIDNELYPYDSKMELHERQKLKGLINIYEGKLNDIGEPYRKGRGKATQPLTKSWYEKQLEQYIADKQLQSEDNEQREGSLIRLSKRINNYIHNVVKAKSNDIMWTCYKETNEDDIITGSNIRKFKTILSNKGYASDACFAPVNCKGTNKYGDRHNLVYAVNFYIQPQIKNFFKYNNININQELYSLSFLLQWIWRSAIRNGEAINLYIPSKRMRTLLKQWLDGKI